MKKSVLLCAAALVVPLAVPAYAQDAGAEDEQSSGIADIVVTAQRREQSAQDVPIAITAFNAATLETRGVSSALEVAQFVPNLVGLNNTGLGTANAYYLRGIGNTESIATFDPPVGTYIDDIYMSRQNANNFSFFDVERVEVLRGPQGTLFGRNTTGGAVSVVMKDPGDEFGGYAEVGYGSYNRTLARASVDVPLAPSFAVKVSGYWQNDDGYAKNTVTGETTNENDGWGLRLGIKGELSDSVTWRGSYVHSYANSANLLNFDCNPANLSDCDGRFVSTGLRKTNDFNRFTGEKDNYGLGNRAWMNLVTSNLEVGVGGDFKVNLITGFVDLRQKFALDFADGRSLPSVAAPIPVQRNYTFGGFTIANDGQHTQFTQEIKLSGSLADGMANIIAGVYYFHEVNDTDFGDFFNLGGPGPVGTPFTLADRRLKNSASAWAGYGQIDFHPIDNLTITAGIRYTDETKTLVVRDNRAACQAVIGATCLDNSRLFAVNGTPIPTQLKTAKWTPRFAMDYRVNDDFMLFASATNGFKSGGWNARASAPSEMLPFDPETAWSYEAGFKADLLDRRLRVNLTAFLLDVSGLQTPSAFVRPNGSIAFITRNFADYRNQGLELEVTAQPADGLTLFGSLGFQDDEYRLPANAPATDIFGVASVASQLAGCLAQLAAGRTPGGAGADNANQCANGIVAPNGKIAEPVRTPKWTLALGMSYAAQMGGGLSLIPAVNANWRSASEVGTSNLTIYSTPYTSPGGTVYGGNPFGNGTQITGSVSPARWLANASITLKSEAGWSLVAECKNCFDELSIESTLSNTTYYGAPRTWAIRAKYEF
jgi:iron complex outermembrane receptor protein